MQKKVHETMQQQKQQKWFAVNLHDITFTALNITSVNCFAPLIVLHTRTHM